MTNSSTASTPARVEPSPRREVGADAASAGPNPWPLALLTVVVTVLVAIGVLPEWPGIVQTVGLAPLDVNTDLRMLFVGAPSYPIFVGLLVVSLAIRSVVLAAMMGRLSWSGVWFALRFYLVTLPLGILSAAAFFASPATLFYLLFWIGFVLLLVQMCLFAAAPWASEPRLWTSFTSQARRGFRLGTVAAYLLLATILGAAADAGGHVVTTMLVPVSGALTYATVWVLAVDPNWRWLRIGRRSLALCAYLALYALVLVVVTGPPGPVPAGDDVPSRQGSLLLMSGVDSSSGSGAILEIDPRALGYSCDQTYYYSYAGPGDGQPQNDAQCPIRTGAPYEPRHTFDTTPVLVQHFVDQVEAVPEPVTVATHSQGVWIVWEALAEHGPMGVTDLVLIGPFPDNPVSYPPFRGHEPGRVGTDVIDHLVSNLARPGGTSAFQHDSPLAVELLSDPDATAAIWSKPLSEEIAVLSVPSSFDLPITGTSHDVDGAVNVCPLPVAHPNLPYSQDFVDAVNRQLDGLAPSGCPWWRTAVGTFGRPFGVPPTGA
jgi:hypothetical protein